MFRNSRPAVSGTLRLYDFERVPFNPAISCEQLCEQPNRISPNGSSRHPPGAYLREEDGGNHQHSFTF
jgi:hypothetical protein